MKPFRTFNGRRLLLVLPLWVLFLVMSPSAAHADPYFISTRPEIGPAGVNTYLGLEISNTGPRGFMLAPGGSFDFPNMGVARLDSTPADYTGTQFLFHLYVYNGVDEVTLYTSAGMFGAVTNQGVGGVIVDFVNTPIVFQILEGPGPYGPAYRTLALTIDDLFIPAGGTAVITGGIRDVTAPEPATLLLMGTGLAAVAGAVRKRRNKGA